MDKRIAYFGLFLSVFGLTGLAMMPSARADKNVSQTDITGVNVWNEIPPLLAPDLPEFEALIDEINAFNQAADTAYSTCRREIDAILNETPRRFARPDSPNANLPLPASCERLEALRPEGERLRAEVAALEAELAAVDRATW